MIRCLFGLVLSLTVLIGCTPTVTPTVVTPSDDQVVAASPTRDVLPEALAITPRPAATIPPSTITALRATRVAEVDADYRNAPTPAPECEVQFLDLTTDDVYVDVPFDAYVSMVPITSHVYNGIMFMTPNIGENVGIKMLARIEGDENFYQFTKVMAHADVELLGAERVSSGKHLLRVMYDKGVRQNENGDFYINISSGNREGGEILLYMCP